MQRPKVLLIIAITLACFLAVGTVALAAFEGINVGARSIGLGGAAIATSDDSTALFWNPALLADVNLISLVSMYGELYSAGNLANNWLSVSYPFGDFSIAAATSQLNQKAIAYKETTILLGAGLNLGNLNLGLKTKHYNLTTPVGSGRGLGLDLGARYRLNRFDLALVVKDLISNLKYTTGLSQPNETAITAGVAYKTDSFLLEADLNPDHELSLGIEKAISNQTQLRAGLCRQEVSFGIGLNLNAWKIDYAYQTHAMGGSNFLTLGFSW